MIGGCEIVSAFVGFELVGVNGIGVPKFWDSTRALSGGQFASTGLPLIFVVELSFTPFAP